MSIKSLQHSSLSDNRFYRSMLAGNEYYVPFTPADDILEEIVLASSASSVTLSGLGAYTDYQHLQVRMTVSDTRSGADGNTDLTVRFNGDSTYGNYSHHRLRGRQNGTIEGAGTALDDDIRLRFVYEGLGGNIFGSGVLDILDFSNSSKNTTARFLGGAVNPANESEVTLTSGLYKNTSAITSIQFNSLYDGFATGSRFSLIGVR